jgi:hypothetical protein
LEQARGFGRAPLLFGAGTQSGIARDSVWVAGLVQVPE